MKISTFTYAQTVNSQWSSVSKFQASTVTDGTPVGFGDDSGDSGINREAGVVMRSMHSLQK